MLSLESMGLSASSTSPRTTSLISRPWQWTFREHAFRSTPSCATPRTGMETSNATIRYNRIAATTGFVSAPAATAAASAIAGCRDVVESARTVRSPGSGPPSKWPTTKPITAMAATISTVPFPNSAADRGPRRKGQRQGAGNQQHGTQQPDRSCDPFRQRGHPLAQRNAGCQRCQYARHHDLCYRKWCDVGSAIERIGEPRNGDRHRNDRE